jgi:uracil-DNA glycosylase family 4
MNDKLQQLYKEIKECQACPKSGWASGHKKIGWGTTNKILFVGQSPAFTSLGQVEGESKFDKSFLSLLDEAGICRSDFFFTNLVKFPPIKDEIKFSKEDLEHCYKHLDDEISLVKPLIIVSLGYSSSNWLRQYAFGEVFFIAHPGIVKYKMMTREQYVAKLLDLKLTYEKIKGRKIIT